MMDARILNEISHELELNHVPSRDPMHLPPGFDSPIQHLGSKTGPCVVASSFLQSLNPPTTHTVAWLPASSGSYFQVPYPWSAMEPYSHTPPDGVLIPKIDKATGLFLKAT